FRTPGIVCTAPPRHLQVFKKTCTQGTFKKFNGTTRDADEIAHPGIRTSVSRIFEEGWLLPQGAGILP
ncbi:MAG TPA: hypothetical protein PKV71_01485, partial [Calditrichia bacterium]|nr:hypothetical protein [Calditrichia bacterium]